MCSKCQDDTLSEKKVIEPTTSDKLQAQGFLHSAAELTSCCLAAVIFLGLALERRTESKSRGKSHGRASDNVALRCQSLLSMSLVMMNDLMTSFDMAVLFVIVS